MKSVLARLGMSSTADQNAQTSFRATTYTASAPCSAGNSTGAHSAPSAAGGQQAVEQEARAAREGAGNVGTVVELLHQMAFRALLGSCSALRAGHDAARCRSGGFRRGLLCRERGDRRRARGHPIRTPRPQHCRVSQCCRRAPPSRFHGSLGLTPLQIPADQVLLRASVPRD